MNCPQIDPAPCTTAIVTACIPKYDLPCTTDAPCGDGFTCVPDQECGCAGNAGSAPPVPGNSRRWHGRRQQQREWHRRERGRGRQRRQFYRPRDLGSRKRRQRLDDATRLFVHDARDVSLRGKDDQLRGHERVPDELALQGQPERRHDGLCRTRGRRRSSLVVPSPPPQQLVCVPPYSDLGISRNGSGEVNTPGGTFGSAGSGSTAPKGAPDGTAAGATGNSSGSGTTGLEHGHGRHRQRFDEEHGHEERRQRRLRGRARTHDVERRVAPRAPRTPRTCASTSPARGVKRGRTRTNPHFLRAAPTNDVIISALTGGATGAYAGRVIPQGADRLRRGD